jgi:hypothetical protein
MQSVPELPPYRKHACADSKRDSKMIKINFSVAHITAFSISPIPKTRPQVLLKSGQIARRQKLIIDIATINKKFT